MEASFVIISILVTCLGLGSITLFLKYGEENNETNQCPCSETRFCERIKDTSRKEIFVFSVNAKQDDWKFYNWDKVTTVVLVEYFDIQLVCWAHKYGARAMIIGGVSTSVFPNKTARSEWIQEQLDFVDKNYLDGINFDYEKAIPKDQIKLRNGYTDLVKETREAFREKFPYAMISVDVAWSPDCKNQRCYDYVGLSKASDFLFVMSYDQQSEPGECIAGSNSGLDETMSGIRKYLDRGISSDKLVLGLPWYGYYYACVSLTQENKCVLKKDGVNCTEDLGHSASYSSIIQLLKNSTSGRILDKSTMTPFFNYLDTSSGIIYQMQYDDPQSLSFKYKFAVDQNLRGVGMWNADCVNYRSQLPEDIVAVNQMWDALPDYNKM